MKSRIFFLLFLLAMSAKAQKEGGNGQWHAPQRLLTLKESPVALIPFPQQVQWLKEGWKIPSQLTIVVDGNQPSLTENAVRSLKLLLASSSLKSNLKSLLPNEKLPPNAILLKNANNPSLKAEGYQLNISAKGILISANDAAGFYYAVQTLRQIMAQKNAVQQLPGCNIIDWPAFALRGFMHDNGRNFQSIAMLKAQLDKLSWYKFNTFHWHLTDNPAWRAQSKIYPQLNSAQNRMQGRDPDSSYSFEDIRELIRYARERNISIIPEFDMPGHSKYFEPTFGFKMESEQGMQVLEKLIDEFCAEVPVSDCPIIHLGSDEVRIPNPAVFIKRMTARVKANNRKVMVWNPGLPPEPGTIEQIWLEDATFVHRRTSQNPYVDSYAGYLNNYDAYSLIQRYFFQQICSKPSGDSLALGGILCCWPDVRVGDKTKIPLYNPVWPGSITFSESLWCGRPDFTPNYMNVLPAIGTEASNHFVEFEQRLRKHKQLFFSTDHFPYVPFGHIEWNMSGPFYRNANDSIDREFIGKDAAAITSMAYQSKIVTGGILRFEEHLGGAKKLSKTANETVYLTAYTFSANARNIDAIIGFEAAARSNRRSAGIPNNGQWDANGGAIFINDKVLQGPVWNMPGGQRYLQATWDKPANEVPYTGEEFYWSRPPAVVALQKGWNKIFVRVPRTYLEQKWIFAFVPVKQDPKGNWMEDASVRIQASKK
jgi:hexosaminidase